MNRPIQLVVVLIVLLAQAATADSSSSGHNGLSAGFAGRTGLPERVLHFPPGQSVGQIALIDETCVIPEISREFHPGYVFAPSEYLGPAQGDVRIPAGKCAIVHLGGKGVTRQQCLDALKSLGPNDAQDLDFLTPIQPDDTFLPAVARLTGITHFCPVTARFSGKGWTLLQTLPRLTHLCTPYGLTDEEMAGIATLPTVDEMEIVADRLTDAGLVSLAKLRNLQVLHLEGTPMMTDEGLKALATLPRLRHLRLSGPFTDQGLAYLAAAPAIKAMWLETPRATEEGLRHLSQIPSLERLTVPWLDLVTHRSLVFLRAMPRLKALGVGDALSSDAGVAALASLSNLEVLALKGSPALTDNGLMSLAAMPKLRALEIYHSRITERGIAGLAACRKLDSIRIKSSVAVSRQAIARLQTESAQPANRGYHPARAVGESPTRTDRESGADAVKPGGERRCDADACAADVVVCCTHSEFYDAGNELPAYWRSLFFPVGRFIRHSETHRKQA